jgi:hypothetical protein
MRDGRLSREPEYWTGGIQNLLRQKTLRGYGGLLGHFSKKPFSVPLSHRSRLQVM